MRTFLCFALGALFLDPFVVRGGEEAGPNKEQEVEVIREQDRQRVTRLRPWHYMFVEAGYRFIAPAKYDKASFEQGTQLDGEFARVLSNRKAGEAIPARLPPVFFNKESDPARSRSSPPKFVVSYLDQKMIFSPEKLDEHLKALRLYQSVQPRKAEGMEGQILQVAGVDALQVQTTFRNSDHQQYFRTTTLIPHGERLYEVTFRYDEAFKLEAERDQELVLKTFTVGDLSKVPHIDVRDGALVETLPPNPRGKWNRVMWWTLGAFMFGVLLHYVLKWLTGVLMRKFGVELKDVNKDGAKET